MDINGHLMTPVWEVPPNLPVQICIARLQMQNAAPVRERQPPIHLARARVGARGEGRLRRRSHLKGDDAESEQARLKLDKLILDRSGYYKPVDTLKVEPAQRDHQYRYAISERP